MIRKILNAAKMLFTPDLYGFISPSVRLDGTEFEFVRSLVRSPSVDCVEAFERGLSEYLGGGDVITFGAGRMAFYALLKVWGIGAGDEVILTGFTCSVMANAVLRTGATPVYCDIDKDTLGLSAQTLQCLMTPRTRVIVAQHTFGIPCEIDRICAVARNQDIRVIEDCALSLGSSYKGRTLGRWGDAAIFSTDHTKPLNTLIGGFAYTENPVLARRLRVYRDDCPAITEHHAEQAVCQYVKEHAMEALDHRKYLLADYLKTLRRKLHLPVGSLPYLQRESSATCCGHEDYPYPAKLHPALAYIGLMSLQQYKASILKRKEWMVRMLEIVKDEYIPRMYFNHEADIVPLRVAFLLKNRLRGDFAFIDDWVWFKQPIVATSEPLINFGYRAGTCRVSEMIGSRIMNIPIVFDTDRQERFLKLLGGMYSC